MDRMYKKADTVNVYATQADKDSGNILCTIERVPYSYAGFDNYRYEGVVYYGFMDSVYDVDACIILTKPCK